MVTQLNLNLIRQCFTLPTQQVEIRRVHIGGAVTASLHSEYIATACQPGAADYLSKEIERIVIAAFVDAYMNGTLRYRECTAENGRAVDGANVEARLTLQAPIEIAIHLKHKGK